MLRNRDKQHFVILDVKIWPKHKKFFISASEQARAFLTVFLDSTFWRSFLRNYAKSYVFLAGIFKKHKNNEYFWTGVSYYSYFRTGLSYYCFAKQFRDNFAKISCFEITDLLRTSFERRNSEGPKFRETEMAEIFSLTHCLSVYTIIRFYFGIAKF